MMVYSKLNFLTTKDLKEGEEQKSYVTEFRNIILDNPEDVEGYQTINHVVFELDGVLYKLEQILKITKLEGRDLIPIVKL